MIITSRWSRERLLVLVGEKHVTAVGVGQDWRGRWCAKRMATVLLEGELSVTSLAASLRRAVDGWQLDRAVGIHWFLPPDVLAVSLVGKSTGNTSGQLVLPHAQGQTVSMLMSAQPDANVWLWIHQAWVDMLQQASESIQGHILYLHPRAVFFAHVLNRCAPSRSASNPAALQVMSDGRYAHLFAVETCVRSFTHSEEATPADGSQGARELSELNAVSMVLGLPISSDRIAGPSDDGFDTVRLTSLSPVDGATLHRTGILCHSLAILAERRIRHLAIALSMAVMAGVGALYMHQQQTAQLNLEMRKELRELVPQANTARELKTVLTHQKSFLAFFEKLNNSPNLFEIFGSVIGKIPSDTTLTDVEMSVKNISFSVYVQNIKKARTEINIDDDVFKVLKVQPDMDEVTKTGGVYRTYASTLSGDQP